GREQLEARARAVAPAEARLRQGLAELARERARLDAEQARLRAAELAGPGRLEQERRALEARSVELARREQALSELCRRWARRRREELERLRGELARWQEARLAWAGHSAELERRRRGLEDERRQLA